MKKQKERKKRSIIWTTSSDEFHRIIQQSKSIADICRHFKFGVKGGTYKAIRARIEKEKLDISHFEKRNPSDWTYLDKKTFMSRLKENTPSLDRGTIKRKLLEFELVKNECSECQLGTIWNNKPLVLHLDHINGDNSDNRLENLRLICPNCHTQTPTFSMGKRKRKKYFCSECGNKTEGYGKRCFECGHISRRRAIRPSKEELEKMIMSIPMTQIAVRYKVSDNAIRKWCKSYEIEYRVGRGYWS